MKFEEVNDREFPFHLYLNGYKKPFKFTQKAAEELFINIRTSLIRSNEISHKFPNYGEVVHFVKNDGDLWHEQNLMKATYKAVKKLMGQA